MSDSSISILGCISSNPILTVHENVCWHEKRTIFRSVWFISSTENAPEEPTCPFFYIIFFYIVHSEYIRNTYITFLHHWRTCLNQLCHAAYPYWVQQCPDEPSGLVQTRLSYCRWRWGLTSSPPWLCSLLSACILITQLDGDSKKNWMCKGFTADIIYSATERHSRLNTKVSSLCRSTENFHCSNQYDNIDSFCTFS